MSPTTRGDAGCRPDGDLQRTSRGTHLRSPTWHLAIRRARFMPVGLGRSNNWACGNDVAVCRADRAAQRAKGWAPVRLLP